MKDKEIMWQIVVLFLVAIVTGSIFLIMYKLNSSTPKEEKVTEVVGCAYPESVAKKLGWSVCLVKDYQVRPTDISGNEPNF